MRLVHSSRQKDYRDPPGALHAGATVRLSLRVWPEDTQIQSIYLAYAYGLYQFQSSRSRMLLQPVATAAGDAVPRGPVFPETGTDCFYSAALRLPTEPGLFFYWFEIESTSGTIWYTCDREVGDGLGVISGSRPHFLPGEAHAPVAWQITVYAPDFDVPEWLKGAVIYQIFPDRFRRDAAFTEERFEDPLRPERIHHAEWQEDVDIAGKPETGYIACDFFGGSLRGILEKIDYIANLGVTVIYLNPIFASRSNHRYDTGDYEQIDPMLGSIEDFQALCSAALDRGIRIILDGVFSHTGADSRYFNKYGRYTGVGAYQEAIGQGQSPYGSWYVFHRKGNQLYYDSWWGFQDLPSVNEHDLEYRSYITGPNGIVRRWLRLGASGWRLDVSDELPDSFLRDLRTSIKAEKPDAALLGEVWEDASHKISYGSYRDFLLGNTHDHVMGYPFQQALTGWLAGHFPAERLFILLENLHDHYPTPSFLTSFNLISSHDIPRAITTMAGAPDPGKREQQALIKLSPEERRKGEALLRLAVLFQMIYPGCPVIYYGDETGMEGYRDPFNRRTFPWGQENTDLQTWFGWLGRLRRDWPVLCLGQAKLILTSGDCLAMTRWLDQSDGPQNVLLVMNRSSLEQTVELPARKIVLPPFGWLLEADGKPLEPPPT